MAGECQTSCPCWAGSRLSRERHTRHRSTGARLQQEGREKPQRGPEFSCLAECGKGKIRSCRQALGLEVPTAASLLLHTCRFS